MKVYLLPENGRFYKANMHSHSTLSDGKFSPEEIKESYKEHGYSVFAYTEHDKFCDLRHLDDDAFLTLPSYEMAFRNWDAPAFPLYEGEPTSKNHMECMHINLFAIDPEKTTAIVDIEDIKAFTAENINEAVRRAKAAGYFAVYNHPHWSLNTHALYSKLEGFDGLEIINGAAYRSSGFDFTPHVYRELCWQGKRLVAIAGDDNHHKRHFHQAWTMIKADSLDHKTIMSALQAGNCYASAGPEIKELYVEDGVLHITTSEAQGIFLATAGRRKNSALMGEDMVPVTQAEFALNETDEFFYVMVKDLRGRPAMTRAYFLDEADFGIPETV